MKILDLQTGRVHEYGTNPHDSLYVSRDGRCLTYYNLQNGDGSGVGDYRFVCDDDKIPAESETAEAIHCDVYFNIGGWNRPRGKWIKAQGEWVTDKAYKICFMCSECKTHYEYPFNFCPYCGAEMSKEV